MSYATAFLSHAHENAQIVHAVADRLGWWGVIPWIDEAGLRVGDEMPAVLEETIHAQRVFVVFVSAAAARSEWVSRELRCAREAHKLVVPVCLEKSVEVPPHWQLEDTLQVRSGDPAEIASRVADTAIRHLGVSAAQTFGVCLDQRGAGRRVGPTHRRVGDWPTLVFRIDRGERTDRDLIASDQWDEFWQTVHRALKLALGQRGAGARHVHVTGDGQLSAFFRLGRILDRQTVSLTCHSTHTRNLGAPRLTNLHRAVPNSPVRGPGGPSKVTLHLMPDDPGYRDLAERHTAACARGPVKFHPTSDHLQQNDANELTDELLPLVRGLSAEYARIHLYSTLPVHYLPLLAAELKGAAPRVTFWEFDRKAAECGHPDEAWYVPFEV